MAESEAQSVLQRMAAAGREAAPEAGCTPPERVLASSLSRAAEATLKMAVVASASSERFGGLPDVLETVAEEGLLAVLEGPGDAQGLMSFDTGLLSAVIEKQMTGVLAAKPPPARPVTRTDAALAADLIDTALREFETPMSGRPEACWATGFGYSSHVDDIRPLGLLLEEIDYRVFSLDLDLEQGRRNGRLVLALPAIGRAPMDAAVATTAADAGRDAPWRAGFDLAVNGAQVRLEAILHRLRLPFSEVRDLTVGDEIPLPVASIDRVRLTAPGKRTCASGRLGQCRGNRALRIAVLGDLPQEREQPLTSLITLADLPASDSDVTQDQAPFTDLSALPEVPPMPADGLDGRDALEDPEVYGSRSAANPLASDLSPVAIPDLPPLSDE